MGYFLSQHFSKLVVRLLASNKIDVKPMITDTLKFDDSIQAFERAAKNLPKDVKLQLSLRDIDLYFSHYYLFFKV